MIHCVEHDEKQASINAIRDVFPNCDEKLDIPHVIHNFKKAVRSLAKKERQDANIWADRCSSDLCIIMEHCLEQETEEKLEKRIDNMMDHYADNCGPLCLHSPDFIRGYQPLNDRAPFYLGLKQIIQNVKSKVPKIWKSKGVGKLTGLHTLIVRRVPKGTYFQHMYPCRVGIAIGEYTCGHLFFKNVMQSYGLKLSSFASLQLIKQKIQSKKDHIRKATPANRFRASLLQKAKQKRTLFFQRIPKRPPSQLRLSTLKKKMAQGVSKTSAPSHKSRKCSYCSHPGHTRATCTELKKAPPSTGSGILR